MVFQMIRGSRWSRRFISPERSRSSIKREYIIFIEFTIMKVDAFKSKEVRKKYSEKVKPHFFTRAKDKPVDVIQC
tara:strand:- start:781 stop:1005 length:225 start_codon:yes stop_codon:yes gene_type:complete